MYSGLRRLPLYFVFIIALLAQPGRASADAVADFYRGKSINLIVVFSPGGMYGIYSRHFAEHFGRHVPGNPNIVVQHLTGAGGVRGANHLAAVAPKDGTYLGMVSKDVAVTQVLRPTQVRYDAGKFTWVGRINIYTATFSVWASHGIKSIEDAKRTEVIIGSSGKASHEYMNAMLLNTLIGTKIRPVTGYEGAAGMDLAMEQGETHGRIGAWLNLKLTKQDWLQNKKVNIIAQTGLRRSADLPNTPTLVELIPNPADRKMMEFIEGGAEAGWGITTPPGVPQERVAALRKAFNAMLADPKFQAEARKRQLDLDSASGEEVQKHVAATLATPPEVIARLRRIVE
jgi:tripartite-type tricarboxylate transporter receptor subunit TctC